MTGDPTSLPPFCLPAQSPLFHATQADRYDRQALIIEYEQRFNCCFIVMIDAIFPWNVTLFEDLIYDAEPNTDLHLLLASSGGDGETAVRLVRAAQARCRTLTVIVPDQAKSAATLLALGAHQILMSKISDLGPMTLNSFITID
jgi:membrane-bound ClpP family serine protease